MRDRAGILHLLLLLLLLLLFCCCFVVVPACWKLEGGSGGEAPHKRMKDPAARAARSLPLPRHSVCCMYIRTLFVCMLVVCSMYIVRKDFPKTKSKDIDNWESPHND